MKNTHKLALVIGLIAVIGFMWGMPAESKSVDYAKVTYLSGKAFKAKSEKGPWATIKKGNTIPGGYFIKTAQGAKVELTMPDNSKLRIGPDSIMHLESAKLTNSTPTRNYSTRVVRGRVYARATPNQNNKSTFVVRSGGAVAGARGTAFNTILLPDGSTRVKCFEGEVFVATWADYAQRYLREPQKVDPNAPLHEPDTVPGPGVITEEEWYTIAGAMLSVTVNPDGSIGQPAPFTQNDMDDWEDWNRKMDGA